MSKTFRRAVTGLFIAAPILFSAKVGAQVSYVPVNVTTPDPEPFISVVSPASCDSGGNTVPDGGYVRKSTTQNPLAVNLDAHSTITGTCQFWWGGVHYPQYDAMRGIVRIDIAYTRPGQLPESWYRYPGSSQLQDYDTRTPPPGGHGSVERDPDVVGTYSASFQTVAFETNCNIHPYSSVVSRTFNVLTCQPKFEEHTNGNTIRLVPPGGSNKVQVYLDPINLSGMGTALDDAISAWNAQLSGTGIEFQKVGTPCGTGPACISVVPTQQSNCGFSWRNWNSNGEITGNMELRIRNDWATLPFSPSGLLRTFIHELGHFLGLDNYNAAACGTNDAAMQDQFTCNSVNMTAVTINDYLPVLKAVYGGKSKVTCGF